jgi:hypothetical protein
LLGKDWLGELPRAISFHALLLLEKEHVVALKAIPSRSRPQATINALGDCVPLNCTIRGQFGLPCRHEIARKELARDGFVLADVHQRWHLSSRLEDDNQYARLKNPLPAPRGRGRPSKNKKNANSSSQVPSAHQLPTIQPSLRRDPSGFEYTTQPETGDSLSAGVTVVRPSQPQVPTPRPSRDVVERQDKQTRHQKQDEEILELLQPTRRSQRQSKPSRAAVEAAETIAVVKRRKVG